MKTGKQIWNYSDPEYFKLCNGVVDNRVFYKQTNRTDPDNIVSNVVALDVVTGNKIWNYTFKDTIGQVEITKESVYIRTDTVYCVDVITGVEKWAYKPEDYGATNLVVTDSSVYVNSVYNLHCLDASTGSKKWTYTDVGATSGLCADGDEVYVATSGPRANRYSIDYNVHCLDANTGAQIWNYTVEGNPADIIVIDGIVYLGADQASSYSFPETGYVYALKPTIEEVPVPHSPSSLDTQQILIAVAGVSTILVVTLFVYKRRQRA
jgi:outer membrane protein assembly factor BamB